jgi:hypothetical protein
MFKEIFEELENYEQDWCGVNLNFISKSYQ